jgi:threonine aldolase
VIDLRSDTATRPTPAMRQAIARAEVGDEQLGEDPTVRMLEERVAELLGKEAAVFLPSGTMANVIALFVLCSPGDEVILHRLSHVVYSENAGPAVHARVSLRQVEGEDGTFGGDAVVSAMQPAGHQKPRTRLVGVENTNNRAGGAIWPLERLDEVITTARGVGLATHLDGARLVNAAVGSGMSCARLAGAFDSASLDLSKGLGCPVGALLVGDPSFIEEARWAKHLFGGALRQAGILAAAGLYALDHHVDRMAEDHALARELADGVAALPGVALAQTRVDTNIVHIDVAGTGIGTEALLRRAAAEGVLLGRASATVLRAVTHLDVSPDDVCTTIETLARAIRAGRPTAV